MPLPIQGGETALGLWRLRATLIMPTLVDDGAGGQIVDWAPGASFAAYRETAAMTEAITVGLRTQALLTVLTWFRRDIKAETDFGVNARLQVTDGVRRDPLRDRGHRVKGRPARAAKSCFWCSTWWRCRTSRWRRHTPLDGGGRRGMSSVGLLAAVLEPAVVTYLKSARPRSPIWCLGRRARRSTATRGRMPCRPISRSRPAPRRRGPRAWRGAMAATRSC